MRVKRFLSKGPIIWLYTTTRWSKNVCVVGRNLFCVAHHSGGALDQERALDNVCHWHFPTAVLVDRGGIAAETPRCGIASEFQRCRISSSLGFVARDGKLTPRLKIACWPTQDQAARGAAGTSGLSPKASVSASLSVPRRAPGPAHRKGVGPSGAGRRSGRRRFAHPGNHDQGVSPPFGTRLFPGLVPRRDSRLRDHVQPRLTC
jgi:hypothetical protein